MGRKHMAMAALWFVAACGGGSESALTPGSEPTAYADMNFAQRYAFMNDVVMPQMKETFVAFDAKFASMSCATCHGNGAADGSFVTPSPQVAALPGSEEAFLEYVKDPEHARWSQFMLDEVWPKMAGLLQVDMFDPTTHAAGFSCSNCHTVEGGPH